MIFFIVLASYLIASYKDPGIIRSLKLIRNSPAHTNGPLSIDKFPVTEPGKPIEANSKHPEQPKELEDENSGPISTSAFGQSPIVDSEDEQEPQGRVSINNVPQQEASSIYIETRFCTKCTIEIPIRAKHCRYCDVCISFYDHHCPWMNNCVGERNRFNFWWYLFFECILLNWSFYISINSIQESSTFISWLKGNYLQLIALILEGFFGLMVSFLLFFHSYLILSNKTTWEHLSRDKISYLKEWPKKLGSPFSKGLLKNVQFFCCKPLPKDYTVWSLPSKIPT